MLQQLLSNIERESGTLRTLPLYTESDAMFLQAIILAARTLEETASMKLGAIIRDNKEVRETMMARAATPKT